MSMLSVNERMCLVDNCRASENCKAMMSETRSAEPEDHEGEGHDISQYINMTHVLCIPKYTISFGMPLRESQCASYPLTFPHTLSNGGRKPRARQLLQRR